MPLKQGCTEWLMLLKDSLKFESIQKYVIPDFHEYAAVPIFTT